MQMLSDLDRIIEALWLTIGAAAAFFVAGMVAHVAIRLTRLARAAARTRPARPARTPR